MERTLEPELAEVSTFVAEFACHAPERDKKATNSFEQKHQSEHDFVKMQNKTHFVNMRKNATHFSTRQKRDESIENDS